MKIFDHPNLSNGWVCPICKTDKDMPVALISIAGTEEDNKIQVERFHVKCIVECIELTWVKEKDLLLQVF